MPSHSASPARARLLASQTTSPHSNLYSGSAPVPQRRASSVKRIPSPHADNLSTRDGIGSFVHATLAKPQRPEFAAAANVTTDHVQAHIFDGHYGEAPVHGASASKRTSRRASASSSAELSEISSLGGVAGYLSKTAMDVLPSPPSTRGRELARPGRIETQGGIFGYLAKLEAEAASRDNGGNGSGSAGSPGEEGQRSSRRGSQASTSARANKTTLREAGGLGAFVMQPPTAAEARAQSAGRAMVGGGEVSATMREGRIGRSLGGYLASPAPAPRAMTPGPRSELGSYGPALSSFLSAPADPLRPHEDRRGEIAAFSGGEERAASLGTFMASPTATPLHVHGGPHNGSKESELDRVGGVAGMQAGGQQAGSALPAGVSSGVARAVSPSGRVVTQLTSDGVHGALEDIRAASSGAGSSSGGGASTSAHKPEWDSFGRTSTSAVLYAARPDVPMDEKRLERLRHTIRSLLPTDPEAAHLTMKHQLLRRDGDRDGRLGDEEVMRALADMAPHGVHASDVGFLCKYLRQRSRQEGSSSGTAALGGAMPVDTIAAFFAQEQQAQEDVEDGYSWARAGAGTVRFDGQGVAGRPNSASPATASTPQRPGTASKTEAGSSSRAAGPGRGRATPSRPTTAGRPATADFASPGSGYNWLTGKMEGGAGSKSESKFESFRARWEGKYGSPAVKELSRDAAEPVDGPTWARADPQPFKVVRLVGGATGQQAQ